MPMNALGAFSSPTVTLSLYLMRPSATQVPSSCKRGGPALHVLADDEAAQRDAVHEERGEVLHAVWLLRVVLRDEPAQRNARERVEAREHHVEDLAAHVLEVDVDAASAWHL